MPGETPGQDPRGAGFPSLIVRSFTGSGHDRLKVDTVLDEISGSCDGKQAGTRLASCAYMSFLRSFLPLFFATIACVAPLAHADVKPILGLEIGGTRGELTFVGATAVARIGARIPQGEWSLGGFGQCALSRYPGFGPGSNMDGLHCMGAAELSLHPHSRHSRLHLSVGAGYERLERPTSEHQNGIDGTVPNIVAGVGVSHGWLRASLEVRHHLGQFNEIMFSDNRGPALDASRQVQLTVGFQFW